MFEITIPWPAKTYNLAKDTDVIRALCNIEFKATVASNIPLALVVPIKRGACTVVRLPNGHLNFTANCVELTDPQALLLQKVMLEQRVSVDMILPWMVRLPDGGVLVTVTGTLLPTKATRSDLEHMFWEISHTVDFVGMCLQECGIMPKSTSNGITSTAWVAEAAAKEAQGPRREEFVLGDFGKPGKDQQEDDHHGQER